MLCCSRSNTLVGNAQLTDSAAILGTDPVKERLSGSGSLIEEEIERCSANINRIPGVVYGASEDTINGRPANGIPIDTDLIVVDVIRCRNAAWGREPIAALSGNGAALG